MFEITKVIEWDMGHRVPNHKNKCSSPHGHRYRLELTIRGELNTSELDPSEGMVHDFCEVKDLMTVWIHDVLDHGFMVSCEDKLMLDVMSGHSFKLIEVPFTPTAENISAWCYQQLKGQLPSHVQIARCRVFETPNSWADYYP